MSKRISMERAEKLRARELELQQMQREGKPLPKSNRIEKKRLARMTKTERFLKYIKKRGGFQPEREEELKKAFAERQTMQKKGFFSGELFKNFRRGQ